MVIVAVGRIGSTWVGTMVIGLRQLRHFGPVAPTTITGGALVFGPAPALFDLHDHILFRLDFSGRGVRFL